MDFLRTNKRLGIYLALLCILALGALVAVWSVTGTGAYLTGEGDWQSLAGDYRIGVIDYTVRINDELLLDRASGESSNPDDSAKTGYKLAVPLLGGVKMFDNTPGLTANIRAQEFNEGATLMRVRVTNYSKNMVDVTTNFALVDQSATGAVPPIRALALPVTLDEKTAATFDYYKYVLDTLGNPADLTALDTAYTTFLAKTANRLELEMGILPGSTTVDPNAANVIKDGNSYCYYKDVFLIVWTEYGDGDHNNAILGATGANRQARFNAEFTVGQLD